MSGKRGCSYTTQNDRQRGQQYNRQEQHRTFKFEKHLFYEIKANQWVPTTCKNEKVKMWMNAETGELQLTHWFTPKESNKLNNVVRLITERIRSVTENDDKQRALFFDPSQLELVAKITSSELCTKETIEWKDYKPVIVATYSEEVGATEKPIHVPGIQSEFQKPKTPPLDLSAALKNTNATSPSSSSSPPSSMTSPLEFIEDALAICKKDFEINEANVDVVTDRNNLRKIFALCCGQSNRWRIDIENRSGVLYLNRFELPRTPKNDNNKIASVTPLTSLSTERI